LKGGKSGVAAEVTMRPRKSLQTTGEISQLVRVYYDKIKNAKKEGRPVVWAFGLIPREIYHALDIPVITLEHFPVMVSAKQLSGKYCQVAEEKGFSRDLCAYHTCFLGTALSEELDPYLEKRFAKPDLILASNFPCNSEAKSFLHLVEHYKCPYFYVDAPINPWGKEVKDHAVEYYAANLERMCLFLERYGCKLDWGKLKEAVELSRQLLVLWKEIFEYRKNVPAPMGATDAYTCLYPVFQLPGTKVAVEVYQKLADEVKYRAENKIGVIENEKLRLLWIGVPPAYNLGLMNYPEQYGAVVVQCEIECIGGAVTDPAILEPEKPLESLAKKNLTDFVNLGDNDAGRLRRRLNRRPRGSVADGQLQTVSFTDNSVTG